jgi:micrococcal nuclease
VRIALLAVLLVALALVVWPRLVGGPPSTLHGRVVRAVDGDTLVVAVEGGGTERVRLIGVDTPEDVDPRKPVQCYSRRAAAFTAHLVTGRQVTLRTSRVRRDRYGRLLAYVELGEAEPDLETELLTGGYARPMSIPPNLDRARRYEALARRAAAEGKGLWSACQ